MFDKIKKTEIHDPEWLKRQEQVLRDHIRLNPMPTKSPKLPITGILATVILVGAIVLLGSSKSIAPIVSPTATPSSPMRTTITPTPQATSSESPIVTASPKPTTTVTPSQTPTVSPTPTSPGNL